MDIRCAACVTSSPANISCRRSSTATRLSIAPTAKPSSSPWTAAKASTGTSRPAISTAARRRSRIGPDTRRTLIVLDQEIPPITPPADTKYIRHMKIKSEVLSKFWGRDMYIGANVLVPEGFDEHPASSLPADRFSRSLRRRLRRLSPRASRSQSQARLQRALPHLRLQPHPAGRGAQVLPAVDRPELSARADREAGARQSLLRRFLRGELRQRRPLWRRHRNRTHPRHRKTISRTRPGLGALHLRRLHRRMGGARRPDVLSRQLQRRLRRLPRPGRLPRLHRRSISTTTRTPTTARARTAE